MVVDILLGVTRMKLVAPIAAILLLGIVGCTATPSGSSERMTADERSISVAECLREAGWEAEIDPSDGGVSVEVPLGQEDQYESASNACWEAVAQPAFSEISESEQRRYYDQAMVLRDCIIELGIDMPQEPSFQAWVDMGGTWSPYADLDSAATQNRMDEIRECPQMG